MGVELVPTPKAPKNRSLEIGFKAKYLSTAHAPVWSQCPHAQNAGYGEHALSIQSPRYLAMKKSPGNHFYSYKCITKIFAYIGRGMCWKNHCKRGMIIQSLGYCSPHIYDILNTLETRV